MIRAAGVLIQDVSGRVLFMRRARGGDEVGRWDFPGGGIEDGETPEEATIRELDEEAGVGAKTEHLQFLTRRCADGVDYTTFIVRNVTPFEPYLNHEHDKYLWAEPKRAPRPLHPGCEVAIRRLGMDELGVARAIRDGQLHGPQQYENIWLVPMRITGTGMAFRHKWDEHVWRDPALYLNDDFLARCNGLPVILEHPLKAVLDTDEFKDRTVGTIMVPYIKGDEVWGIAKMYDSDAVAILMGEQLSTSPAVVWRDPDVNSEQEMENGQRYLIEGKPSLLDHLAICKQGVWDKGGKPEGIDLGGMIMPETTKNKVAADDAAKGNSVDRLLKGLDALNTKLDNMTTRMDSIEAKQKKKTRADDEDDKDDKPKPPIPAPGEDVPPVAADKRRKDADPPLPPSAKAPPPPAESKSDEDEDEEDDDKDKLPPEFLENIKNDEDETDGPKGEGEKEIAREDAGARNPRISSKRKDATDGTVAVKTADLNSLRRELAELRSRLPKDRSDQDAAQLAEDQARCDSVALLFGTAAPRPLAGEARAAYRLRLVEPYKKYSKQWKDVDVQVVAVDEAALNVVEAQIYDAARAAARDPASVPNGTLRAVTTRTNTGHIETRFMGSPSSWLNRNTPTRRYATAINMKKD